MAMADAILNAVREWRAALASRSHSSSGRSPASATTQRCTTPTTTASSIWEGISFEAVTAIKSLLERGAIHFRRSTYEAHQLDGRAPKLRIARERKPPPPNVFCWRPTAICLGPGPGERRIEEQKRYNAGTSGHAGTVRDGSRSRKLRSRP
jgi:hypothetical protein